MLNPIQIIQWQLGQSKRVVPNSFRLLATRLWSKGMMFVYQVSCYLNAKESTFDAFWCDFFEQKADAWLHIGGCAIGMDLPVRSSEMIQFSHGNVLSAEGVATAFVYGRTISPDIVSVEAVFDNAEVVEDWTHDEIFAIALPNAKAVVELRLKNYRGETFETLKIQESSNPILP
ncbi:MAG: hypothetical protein RMM16_00400 [Chloroherpetonaceae bacterium]|nr:hypothetical protein [Chloroherpetonaceae bacterium]